MKKVLSFVLVLAMILGSVSMAFAATEAPFEDAPNNAMATILRNMNVLKGNDDKVFLDQPISRAEVCAILMRVLGYETYCTAEYAINAVSAFKDVASGYWANGYINLAAQLGYVNGIGSGKFNPTGNVGLNDGVAFIMKALGYSADHLSLDWPYNFLVKAEELGLFAGVEKTAGDLTREQMFTILYNAMDKQIQKWEISTVGLVKGDESLGKYVDAASENNTFARKAAKKQLAGNFSTQAALIDTALVKFANGFDASEYLGQKVVVLRVTGGQLTSATALTVLGPATTVLVGNFKSKAGVSTFAAAGVDYSIVATSIGKTFKNGHEEGVAFPPYFEGTEVTADVELNAKGQIATINAISFEELDGIKILTATDVAFLQAESFTSLKAVGLEGVKAADGDVKTYKAASTVPALIAITGDELKAGNIVEVYGYDFGDGHYIAKLNVIDGSKTVVLKSIDNNDVITMKDGSKYVDLSNGEFKKNTTSEQAVVVYDNALVVDEIYDYPVILSSTIVGLVAPAAQVTQYALVLESDVKVINAWDDGEGHHNGSTTPIITLFALSTMEEISPKLAKDLAKSTVIDQATSKWAAGYKNSDGKSIVPVEYKLDAKGQLTYIKNLSANVLVDKKVEAKKIDSKYYADGMKVVAYNPACTTNAALFTEAELVDYVKTSIKGYYVLNEDGAVAYIFVNDATSVESGVITAAALVARSNDIEEKKTYGTIFDGEDKTYVLTSDALEAPIGTVAAYHVNPLTGYVDDWAGYKVASVASVATKSGLKITANSNGVTFVKVSDAGVVATKGGAEWAQNTEIVVVDPVIWVYDSVSGTYSVFEGTVEKALAKIKTVAFFVDFNADGEYDFVVVNGNVAVNSPS